MHIFTFDFVSIFFTILLALLSLLIYILLFWKPKLWIQLECIPGPKKLPIIGNAWDIVGPNFELLDVFQNYIANFGKRVFISFGLTPRVLLADRHDIEKILTSQVHVNKSVDYDYLVPWLGLGLLISTREKWFHRRKLLTPAFHFGILEAFMEIFNEQSAILVDVLKERFEEQKEFDIYPCVANCALDVIVESAMGTKLNVQRESDNEYVRALTKVSELLIRRIMCPWLQPDWIWKLLTAGKEEAKCLKILHAFTKKVIAEKKATIAKSEGKPNIVDSNDDDSFKSKKRLAFLDLLLKVQAEQMASNGQFSDSDVQEEVDTFMFEGHDTTAACIMFTIYLLASHPENQRLVQEELDDIFIDDPNRPSTTKDLTEMKYLECCIKESLRIYPSVPLVSRAIENELKLDANVTLPKGILLTILPYFLHRDPEIFPNPEAFSPERFFPENVIGRHPFAYTPFSAGPRNCIGQKFAMMEIKVVLSTLFRHFTFTTTVKQENIKVSADLILRSLHPIPVSFTPRSPFNY